MPSSQNPTEDELRRYRQASQLMADGHLADARELLLGLAAAATPRWEVYNDLGAIAAASGDLAEALQWLNRAVAAQAEPGQARLGLAMVQKALGRHEDALATLSPLLRQEAANLDALTLLRELLGEAGELSLIAWARLLADLRAPLPEQREIIDRLARLNGEIHALHVENARLKERLAQLETSATGTNPASPNPAPQGARRA